MNRSPTDRLTHQQRRGFLLVVVLAVVVLLSLACYEYADKAVAEREAARRSVQLVEARMAALSGIDAVLAAVSAPEFTTGVLADPEFLESLQEQPVDGEAGNVGFTIMVIDPVNGAWTDDLAAVSYGLVSESGKININTLAASEEALTQDDQREALLQLPNMTETLADVILDFIDADGTPRPYGTESDSGDVVIRNAPLDTLDDLLVLEEIDSIVLYGEDANFNARLDPNEDDGADSPPLDDADGALAIPLASYITVYGSEPNVNSLGDPRIDVNQDNLDTLYNELGAVLSGDVSDFIVAYRKSGGASSGGGGGRGGNRGRSSNSTTEINAIAELIDATVTGYGPSPLVSTDINRLLEVYDNVSTTADETLSGRIDINSAPATVLVALGGLEEATATAIADRNDWSHPVEILTDGVVDLATFRRIEPLLTTSGRTFTFSSIGYVENGPMVRIDAIVDASTSPPKILKQLDMTRVGVGRTLEMVRPSKQTE